MNISLAKNINPQRLLPVNPYQTGFPSIDNAIGGLPFGTLTLLSGQYGCFEFMLNLYRKFYRNKNFDESPNDELLIGNVSSCDMQLVGCRSKNCWYSHFASQHNPFPPHAPNISLLQLRDAMIKNMGVAVVYKKNPSYYDFTVADLALNFKLINPQLIDIEVIKSRLIVPFKSIKMKFAPNSEGREFIDPSF